MDRFLHSLRSVEMTVGGIVRKMFRFAQHDNGARSVGMTVEDSVAIDLPLERQRKK